MLVKIENRSNKVLILDFNYPVRCDIYQTLDIRITDQDLESFRNYLYYLCARLELIYKENRLQIGKIKVIIFIIK
jgi:hypothetical protein